MTSTADRPAHGRHGTGPAHVVARAALERARACILPTLLGRRSIPCGTASSFARRHGGPARQGLSRGKRSKYDTHCCDSPARQGLIISRVVAAVSRMARHGIPHGALSQTPRCLIRHGISRRHGIPLGTVSSAGIAGEYLVTVLGRIYVIRSMPASQLGFAHIFHARRPLSGGGPWAIVDRLHPPLNSQGRVTRP